MASPFALHHFIPPAPPRVVDSNLSLRSPFVAPKHHGSNPCLFFPEVHFATDILAGFSFVNSGKRKKSSNIARNLFHHFRILQSRVFFLHINIIHLLPVDPLLSTLQCQARPVAVFIDEKLGPDYFFSLYTEGLLHKLQHWI